MKLIYHDPDKTFEELAETAVQAAADTPGEIVALESYETTAELTDQGFVLASESAHSQPLSRADAVSLLTHEWKEETDA